MGILDVSGVWLVEAVEDGVMLNNSAITGWRDACYTTDGMKRAIPALSEVLLATHKPSAPPELIGIMGALITASMTRVNDTVSAHSESPIETLFLQTLGLLSIGRYSPQFIYFDGPVANIIEHIADEVSGLARFEEFYASFGEAGPTMDDIQAMDISDNEKTHLSHRLILYAISHKEQGGYHLNLQAGFPDEINVDGRGIRVDMAFWSIRRPDLRLVVECDGFKHHKTRDSFIRDRRRDRVLRANGWDVVRFSGPEIHSNPIAAAEELLTYLYDLQEGGNG